MNRYYDTDQSVVYTTYRWGTYTVLVIWYTEDTEDVE